MILNWFAGEHYGVCTSYAGAMSWAHREALRLTDFPEADRFIKRVGIRDLGLRGNGRCRICYEAQFSNLQDASVGKRGTEAGSLAACLGWRGNFSASRSIQLLSHFERVYALYRCCLANAALMKLALMVLERWRKSRSKLGNRGQRWRSSTSPCCRKLEVILLALMRCSIVSG